MSPGTHEVFAAIVLGGAYSGKGMGNFSDVLSPADAAAIHDYLIDEAWQMKAVTAKTP
jgi:quinohemoprotein ethanol dehydrogenase